jgi:hypothetical protein
MIVKKPAYDRKANLSVSYRSSPSNGGPALTLKIIDLVDIGESRKVTDEEEVIKQLYGCGLMFPLNKGKTVRVGLRILQWICEPWY